MRRRIALVIVSMFALAGPAAAAEVKPEECFVDLDEMVPLFSHTEATSSLDMKERRLVEHVTLSDGVKVTLARGGCVHYGYTLTFEQVPNITAATPPAELIATIRALLKRLPLKEEDSFIGHLDMLEKTLEKKQLASLASVPCGEATCGIEAPADGQIKLDYDFPL